MSGDKKKRGDRGHGWEEAGGEFYQENYSAAAIEADYQAMQRDPSQIATLLPSKKSRVATAKRVKHNEPRTTLRRKTSTRTRHQSTARRMSSCVQDATVSMLPDLSENLSNEERTWEEIMQIKSMPISMYQKRQLKNQLKNATKLRLQGFDHWKWQRRKAWQQLKVRIKEVYSKLEFWGTSLNKITGNFGMGVASFFWFIKWILFLNFVLFLIISIFLILPTALLEIPKNESCAINITNQGLCCTEMYKNKSQEVINIIDIFKNSEYFHNSLLFYGSYLNIIYKNSDYDIKYNFPLAYLLAIIITYIISLTAIVRLAAKGFRERIVEHEGQFYRYSNLIFGGWDYCLNNDKASKIKCKAIYNELRALLKSEKFNEEKQNRTADEKFKLCLVRIFINTLIFFILCCCGSFIFYINKISINEINIKEPFNLENLNEFSMDLINQLIFEFLPYICIVLLNIIIPILFNYLITLENYSSSFIFKMTLFRIILLRMTLLSILLISFYILIFKDDVEENECTNGVRPLCWETFMGEQLLKLFFSDIIIQFFLTFFINFPRSFIGRNSKNKFLRFIGRQKFDLSKHVLDIIYLQTVCFLGSFFVPMFPLFAIIGLYFVFQLKKFACFINCVPPNKVYRSNRLISLFMAILLIFYIFSIIPISYTIVKISPSKACGPFKGLDSTWNLLITNFYELPCWFQKLINFLSTPSFTITTFIIFILLLYYYYAVSDANKNMVVVLKNQLILEGHDKQFLLNRLSAFIKQQQEQTKYQQEQSEML